MQTISLDASLTLLREKEWFLLSKIREVGFSFSPLSFLSIEGNPDFSNVFHQRTKVVYIIYEENSNNNKESLERAWHHFSPFSIISVKWVEGRKNRCAVFVDDYV